MAVKLLTSLTQTTLRKDESSNIQVYNDKLDWGLYKIIMSVE